MNTTILTTNILILALLLLVLRHARSIKSAITLFRSLTMTQFADVQNSITGLKAAVVAEVQRVANNLTNADPSDTEAARAQAVADLNTLTDQLNAVESDSAQAGTAGTTDTTQSAS